MFRRALDEIRMWLPLMPARRRSVVGERRYTSSAVLHRVYDEITKRLVPWSLSSHVVMLGSEYEAGEEEDAFMQDFHSRLQLTYRKNFSEPIELVGGSQITSDAGWGCMLRVMQMMLAQSFIVSRLGREWRFRERDLAEGSEWRNIVSCFLDTHQAPFSLHNLVDAGQKLFGKAPSSWFGPTSSAKALGSLFSALVASPHVPSFLHKMSCVVFDDGPIFKSTVLQKFESGSEAVVFLVCRRLGLDSLNVATYREGLDACFKLPQFLGLASGNNSTSAYYFFATHGESLLYLDPHQYQYQSLETVEAVQDAAGAGLQASRPFALDWSRLNPSVCMGFLVKSPKDFLALCDSLSHERYNELFEIFQVPFGFSSQSQEVDDFTLL